MPRPKTKELARHRKERMWMWVQLMPVMAVLTILFGGALVLAVMQSLGFAPWFGVNTFPDFSFFGALWSDWSFWQSLGLTLYYAIVSTGNLKQQTRSKLAE